VNLLFRYIIRLYRRYVSPVLPPTCRFVPTCSEYALEAFKKENAFRAAWMTIVRILKCHPFHPGGYDPVNSVREQSSLTIIDRGVRRPSPKSGMHR
jgi:putative membrane protein insertion efficiency factor